MTMKSLLLGSVAALASIPAWAADAIVAAEPEPVDYVRVCDTYGAGYFYIPGTQTCLKINGYVRFQVDLSKNKVGSSIYDAISRGQVQFTAKSDTEYGPLTSVFVYQGNASNASKNTAFGLDTAYLDIAGFRAGFFSNWWDDGIAGESDTLQTKAKFNSIRYQYDAGSFYAGVAVDELEDGFSTHLNDIGVVAAVGGKGSGFTYQVVGGYDTDLNNGAVRAIGTADIGPGSLSLAGVWSSGNNTYNREAKWTVAASYAVKATDKLTITPGVTYFSGWSPKGYWDNKATDFSTMNLVKAGVEVKYQIVDNFYASASGQWQNRDWDKGFKSDDKVSGYFRLQRAF